MIIEAYSDGSILLSRLAMKFQVKLFFKAITCVCTLFLSSCFWPQEFVAVVKISNDATFSATYLGDLIQTDNDPLAFILLSENPDVSIVEELSEFRKKVSYSTKGAVISKAFGFPPDSPAQGSSQFLEIFRYDNGNIRIVGRMNDYEEGRKKVEEITNQQYQLKGKLTVIVDGDVVAHNADEIKNGNEYIWQYNDPDNPKNPDLIIGCADRGQNFCVGIANPEIQGLSAN